MMNVREDELMNWAAKRADDAGRLARDFVTLLRGLSDVVEVLENCEAYFDNKSDVDNDGDPNREMALHWSIQRALSSPPLSRATSSSPVPPACRPAEEMMTEAQIKHMVNRFLSWKLPENFNPDGGVSFKKMFNEHTGHPMRAEPSGTNLLDAVQAEAMVRHMVEGLPSVSTDVLEALHQTARAGNSHVHPTIQSVLATIAPPAKAEGK